MDIIHAISDRITEPRSAEFRDEFTLSNELEEKSFSRIMKETDCYHTEFSRCNIVVAHDKVMSSYSVSRRV